MSNFELVICIDKEAKTSQTLRTGAISELDIFTTNFESSKEIRALYKKVIEKFLNINKNHIDNITKKTKKIETGDIAIIGTINKERSRIKVLYKKHIEVFKTIILYNKFEQYLKKNYYEEYCGIQIYKHKEIEFDERTSFFIRKVYNIYNNYYKENNELSPTKIYTKIKSQQEYYTEEPIEDYIIKDMKEAEENRGYKYTFRGK